MELFSNSANKKKIGLQNYWRGKTLEEYRKEG